MTDKVMILLAVVIGAAALIAASPYTIVPVSTGNTIGAYVLNRYTGSVTLCVGANCQPLREAPAK